MDLTDVRVLVVDDNQSNRRILEKMLIGWQMKPTLTDSGSAALDAMKRAAADGAPFELVLTDCNMPEMDGFKFVEELKNHPELADSMIVMLTSAFPPGAFQRCQQLGITDTLVKPLKNVELRQTIANAYCRNRGEQLRPEVASTVQCPSTEMPLRILLAEDNHVNQRVATRLLTKLGHDVQLAENGQLALDALERSEFDVVLMDVQMPVLDGLEAVAAIRRRETSTGLHQVIIAMTAHTMSGDRERCLDAGMDHYISKPIDAAAVCEALKRVTDQFRLPRAASTPEATETPSASTQPSAFDMDVALAKFDGERDFMMEIAGIFLGGLSDQMTSLKVTLEQGDVSAAARVAHTIKGSVGNFAAERAYAAALQLEKDCRAGNTESLSESHQYFVKEIDRLAEDLRREDAVSV